MGVVFRLIWTYMLDALIRLFICVCVLVSITKQVLGGYICGILGNLKGYTCLLIEKTESNTSSVPTKLSRIHFWNVLTKLSHFFFSQKTIHPITLTLFHHLFYSLFIFSILFISSTFQHNFLIFVPKSFDTT